ncbi:potassium-efflux system protein [Burkholderia pseudomallei]|uniref:Potassium-efflux system protein n=1 Tax=Burkholderia pseudomallei (strain 1026b) TaxID=884204 RepID=A0A0H3HXJ5_BURP2|nr:MULTISPECIES: cation:proton antiporter [Burkholderia]AFI69542.1 potassium-efflux system protein [Burkholderia pseudomallei 1026b]AIO98197.1 ketopantoate reductase PanE/ApbA family protein [Burkholderia pseudomallei 576]AIP16626.1 ketopantoate reductase PanE/ApbA family protein [Burkholderia pseudomallei]AIP45847.1 ketopantoate reductase PanE/ApbA family protein [Burkholderia pseudomallei MSHR5858]AIP58031.1 ketopantoate reductase PanE/ApbA family protein [Burkholderia pseudomallei HBPUB1030
MPHDVSLIALLAAGFGLAMIFGYLASLLKMPPLVGYLLAGIVMGPGTPGFVGDLALAQQLAEIGVMLLMFGVGLHFSLGDLLSVRKIALPGAIVQIAVATALGAGLALWWGWSVGGALVFGLSLSVASTVVLLRALEGRGLIESVNGRIAVGWLVVEDLVMVLVLVLLPPLAALLGGGAPTHGDAAAHAGEAGGSLWAALGVTLLKVAAFVALMLVVGKRVFPRILWLVARTGSRELFTLCMIAAAVGVAFGAAKLFDVSFALGAFFAGMMMRESEFSRRAADETLPLRDAFSVLFFISVGMLFDPRVLIDEPLHVLEVAAIVVLGKTLAAVALVLAFRYPLNTALTVGVSLAQIGEFSFILASLGRGLGLLSAEGQSLILAVALLSIALNTLLFAAVDPVLAWIRKRSAFARRLESRDDPLAALPMSTPQAHLTGQVVIVGYGRVGTRIAHALDARGIAYVVVEQNRETVEKLRADGVAAVSGDAVEPIVLVQAHIARAGMLVVTLPDVFDVRQIVDISRTLNPAIEIALCTNSDEEAALLANEGMGEVFVSETELAHGMTEHVLARMGAGEAHARRSAAH